MDLAVTPENILIFVVFIVVLFLLSRIFKFLLQAVGVAIAGFSFPWIASQIGIEVATEGLITNLQFAGLALGVFLIYSAFSFVIAIVKLIFVPVKILLGKGTGKSEMARLRKEIENLKKK